jgi:hypothetical protein
VVVPGKEKGENREKLSTKEEKRGNLQPWIVDNYP